MCSPQGKDALVTAVFGARRGRGCALLGMRHRRGDGAVAADVEQSV
jgi:hypothetical protein